MGIDHSRFHVLVAEKLLNRLDVIAIFKQMGGKGMTECMAGCMFGDSRFPDRGPFSLLHNRFVHVAPSLFTCPWVYTAVQGFAKVVQEFRFLTGVRRDNSWMWADWIWRKWCGVSLWHGLPSSVGNKVNLSSFLQRCQDSKSLISAEVKCPYGRREGLDDAEAGVEV